MWVWAILTGLSAVWVAAWPRGWQVTFAPCVCMVVAFQRSDGFHPSSIPSRQGRVQPRHFSRRACFVRVVQRGRPTVWGCCNISSWKALHALPGCCERCQPFKCPHHASHTVMSPQKSKAAPARKDKTSSHVFYSPAIDVCGYIHQQLVI